MVFNSLTFVVFFAIVLGVYLLPLPWRWRKAHLLVSSYIFYAAWNPPFVLLIIISTVVDWFVAKSLASATSGRIRVALLVLSLAVNLGLLGAFKYGNFLLYNFTKAAALLGLQYAPPELGLILPVGISFYTFQTLSYTIDVYRGKLDPRWTFLDFALFVTFFPQLVAGPIVRAAHFLPQTERPPRITSRHIGWGLSLLTLGVFEKEMLADAFFSMSANPVFSHATSLSTAEAWLGTLAFSGQILFDFAGYSTAAIGAALCLGFAIPDNFRFPYAAVGFSDFWRRWHISLSEWLRDYLYISLGGNRRGTLRTLVNLVLTMFLGGLWHGASWRFVTWGLLHGGYLVAERYIQILTGQAPWTRILPVRIATAIATYALVCVAWVFFRAESFGDAFAILKSMAGLAPTGAGDWLDGTRTIMVVGGTGILLVGQWLLRDTTLEEVVSRTPGWVRSTALAAMWMGIFMAPGERTAFIYFQF